MLGLRFGPANGYTYTSGAPPRAANCSVWRGDLPGQGAGAQDAREIAAGHHRGIAAKPTAEFDDPWGKVLIPPDGFVTLI